MYVLIYNTFISYSNMFCFVSFLTVYSNGGVEGPDGKVNKSYVF